MSPDDLKAFQKRIGYRFRKRRLLETALTHPSYRHEADAEVEEDNQRLEYLGDAVIGMLTAEFLFSEDADFTEGQMTQLRSILARRDALAALGVDWGIGPLLRLGKGESASGGAARPSNLADAVEAVVGAVWRDGGYRAGHKVFQSQFEPRLREWLQLEGRPLEAENPKGTLQEWLQQRGDPPPEYRIVSEAGPAHDRRYEASVWWKGTELARGEGAGKRAAEARAAAAALQKLRADEVSLP